MTNRKLLETFGRKRRHDYVRIFRETASGVTRVRVQWTQSGLLKTESFPDTRKGISEAKAFGEGVHERLQAKTPDFNPVTIGELWDKYVTAKVDAWRAATLTNKAGRWDKFVLFVGKGQIAQHVTRETLDAFKRALLTTPTRSKRPRSVYQVAQHIEVVTALFRWAVDRDLIPPTKVATYAPEFSRDAKLQIVEMGEFSADERTKVLAQLNPRDIRQWRAWVLTVLFAYCGPRQNAARHLEWRDIDFVVGTIRWRPELDKMATDRVQPMPEPVREAMWVAYGWRTTQGYRGPFVFYGVQDRTRDVKPWTYQAYAAALDGACQRAGVARQKYQGAHAFRRGIAGDVHAKTGSSKKAAEWIGDRSVKIVEKHYLLEREEELRKTAQLVGGDDA
jgi:integrase